MFFPIACLPLAAVLINDVKTERSGGAITVDVVTSEPVTREDVRGVSGGSRRMYLYLQGTMADRKSFGSGAQSVVVHPRARYTKLEIPTDTHCAEPMSIEPTPSGIRVRASCRDSGVLAGMAALPVHLQGTQHSEKPSPEAPLAALAHSKSQSDSLRAALALPKEAAGGDDGTLGEDRGRPAAATEASDRKEPTVAPTVPAKTAENAQAPADKPIVAAPAAATPAKATQPDAPTAAIASVESPSPSASGHSSGEAKSSSSMASTFLAAAILVALGVAAALFARRRTTRGRMIHIVETASIGSRRSLVVACIGGRTMVLGVSEAGVSLLDAQATPALPPPVPEKTLAAPIEEAALGLRNLVLGQSEPLAATSDDAKQEGSLLSRLFQRPQPSSEAARHAHEFNELLSESLEDQELRQRLAQGEAGQVA
jgi:flagellar biogenesis protein FliO